MSMSSSMIPTKKAFGAGVVNLERLAPYSVIADLEKRAPTDPVLSDDPS